MDEEYSKKTLESILDTIPEYIFYRDLKGRNIYCNESYASDFIGKPKDKIYGKTYEELEVLRPYFNIGKVRDKEVIENKKHLKYEQTISNGKEKRKIEIDKYPIFDDDGNVDGILGIIKDEPYKEELSKLREGFFSNIRHEFRTPINMIMTSIQLLEQRCKFCDLGNCKECFVKDIHRININTLRMLKISDNFIDLTNIQSKSMEYKPINYDIVSTVESICDDINRYKKFKNISIIFDTQTEEKIVSFDKAKLERIILNLISNAIKFNNYDGSVIVSILLESDFVVISVKDTGIGIAEDDIDSIFNGFSNVEDRFTKICEGCGVGLALTKHLVEMHQGTITVKSELEKGSEFIVRIPNIVNVNNYVDDISSRVYDSRLERIKMEFSDIYE
ncbi:PAS domain-containing sensor histidine kinase [Romboutsia weinsteinii]|uniref:histidine kinase n=1 Tax=Romboutsia weinsteinii TaxID=2020949 RepID=A0A371J3W2_9FIRM|nr:PAS domain-containing sensor histidine kinase [Romboutsia weinsteinii]RDY27425.1 PAS domain-containing sensor histidine kinase [Romboutsia weinsteinii]